MRVPFFHTVSMACSLTVGRFMSSMAFVGVLPALQLSITDQVTQQVSTQTGRITVVE